MPKKQETHWKSDEELELDNPWLRGGGTTTWQGFPVS
jgi:hypothetical protein